VKFKMTINGHNVLVDAGQLEILTDMLSHAEHLTETHVGNYQGSQGYNNAYVPVIKPVVTHELFTVSPVNQDYIDTVKLTMKLDDNSTIRVTT
jgi:aerobic-type carbon monoxide dehydrogenase small subunit (CoxS/CutS family)